MENTALKEAYEETKYVVEVENLSFELLIGEKNEKFLDWCNQNYIESWIIITAYNPYSVEQTKEQNAQSNEQLLKMINSLGYKVWPAKGVPNSTEWEAEDSFFVCNIGTDIAQKLGKMFKQNAIVKSNESLESELFWLV